MFLPVSTYFVVIMMNFISMVYAEAINTNFLCVFCRTRSPLQVRKKCVWRSCISVKRLGKWIFFHLNCFSFPALETVRMRKKIIFCFRSVLWQGFFGSRGENLAFRELKFLAKFFKFYSAYKPHHQSLLRPFQF